MSSFTTTRTCQLQSTLNETYFYFLISSAVSLPSPFPGSDQVRVGPLQCHWSGVAAQDPDHTGRQLLDPGKNGAHGGGKSVEGPLTETDALE